jgi:hypothetical protein
MSEYRLRYQVLSTLALASRDMGKETSATPEMPGINQTSGQQEVKVGMENDPIVLGAILTSTFWTPPDWQEVYARCPYFLAPIGRFIRRSRS